MSIIWYHILVQIQTGKGDLLNHKAHLQIVLQRPLENGVVLWGVFQRGAIAQEPLEQRSIRTVNWTLGEALGKLYVAQKFPPEAKAQMKELVGNLIKAYESRINALEWMDDATNAKAIEKLEKTNVKVGYPDKWKDYSSLSLTNDAGEATYFDAMVNVAAFEYAKNIAELGEPVDKSKWYMSPQTVNAYYNPPYNEIVFPAAILQPPFFDFTADAAVNYGGIGGVIGHEISHGFDDSGACSSRTKGEVIIFV